MKPHQEQEVLPHPHMNTTQDVKDALIYVVVYHKETKRYQVEIPLAKYRLLAQLSGKRSAFREKHAHLCGEVPWANRSTSGVSACNGGNKPLAIVLCIPRVFRTSKAR